MTESLGLRVARLVDPEAWALADRITHDEGGMDAFGPELLKDLDASLAKADAILALVLPAGWKLVPEEATEKMMDAAVDKARKRPPADDGKFGYVQARAAFSAFLTAAPPPPSDAP